MHFINSQGLVHLALLPHLYGHFIDDSFLDLVLQDIDLFV
jgi:hypothetical protein